MKRSQGITNFISLALGAGIGTNMSLATQSGNLFYGITAIILVVAAVLNVVCRISEAKAEAEAAKAAKAEED